MELLTLNDTFQIDLNIVHQGRSISFHELNKVIILIWITCIISKI